MRDFFTRYAVVIEDTGTNFSADVLDLPGCVATGPNPARAEFIGLFFVSASNALPANSGPTCISHIGR
jgi:hypothetical protein